MSVLLAGQPDLELPVSFSRHKIASDPHSTSDAWESSSRFDRGAVAASSAASLETSVAATSVPAAAPKSPGCGMCVRTATSATSSTTSSSSNNNAPSSAETAMTATVTPRSTPDPVVQPLAINNGVNASIMDIAIRCTAPNCNCDGFAPSKPHIRSCDSCQHGWVAHALDKLGFRHLFNCHSVELVQPTSAFDVASLMLYGTEALPIRLKILLDRLFSVLKREEMVNVLHGFGWTFEDYNRGYILQDVRGKVLEHWTMPSREEEPLILQQFLRFGETKPIAQQLLLQDAMLESPDKGFRDFVDSDIKRFVQKTSRIPTAATVATLHLPRPPKMSSPAEGPTTPTSCQPPMVPCSLPQLAARGSRPPSNVSSTASMSPTKASPTNSPLSSSPLNKLQNMLPFEFRRERTSPDSKHSVLPVLPYVHQPIHSPTSTMASFSIVSNAVTTSFMNSSSRMCLTSDLSLSDTDEGSDNDTDGVAINLSQHPDLGHPHLDSIYAAKKIRHLRKSANPMKRRWNPMMLGGMVTNPSTGKKRVQCHVCLKTFCDKGALKIHFSAVHLREMHKCTVDGCNMMFSSRRSRNRHSANPNPKLHTPNLRRKISHHDGRSSLPYPLMPSNSIMNFNSNSNNLVTIPPTLHSAVQTEIDATVRSMDASVKPDNHAPLDSLESVQRNSDKRNDISCIAETLQLSKKQRLDTNGDLSNDGDEGIDLSVKEDNVQITMPNKGVRKRKSFNPTKCTAASDDDLQYLSTDDTSSDTFVDDNGLLSKSDEFSSDLLEDDSKDGEDMDKDSVHAPTSSPLQYPPSLPCTKYSSPPSHETPKMLKQEVKVVTKPPRFLNFTSTSFTAENLTSKQNNDGTLDLSSKNRDPVIKVNPDVEEVSESPLRHLETLSLGAFTGLLNHTKSTFSHHISSSTGISFHAPGLGLASSGPTETSSREKNSRLSSEPHHLPVSLGNSGIPLNVSDSDVDGQMHMLPMYRDASMISSVEVPVDKENPRRCIACGKIFQNHFGVKTHYQNVHLKVMHKCTVEGCNAAFPSKRSRDRHSANLNLHRKLLSTTADKAHYFEKGAAMFPYHHPSAVLRDDYFSRLYDTQNLPLNFAEFYQGRFQDGFMSSSPFGGPLGMPGPLGMMPNFHPTFMLPTSTSNSSLYDGGTVISDGRDDTPLSSISSTPSPQLQSPSSPSSSSKDRPRSGRPSLSLDSELIAGGDGKYPCNFCLKVFTHAIHLKEHYEGTHLPSLMPCPSDDCHKVFLTKSDKDKHCESEDHGIPRIKKEFPS